LVDLTPSPPEAYPMANRISLFIVQEVLTRALCIAFFGSAMWRFVQDFLATGRPTSLIFVLFLLLVTTFSAFRSMPKEVSKNPVEWLVAVLGTLMSGLMTPAGTDSLLVGEILQALGLLIVAAGLASLNRSFGIVPSNRGIKTGGLYCIVRHPLYMGYLVSDIGLLINQCSGWNAMILALAVAFFVLRIRFEEALLSHDPAYVAYQETTRFRLIPGLW
jgi:protein-S-isoprenylcysteine O-methyltransferase Ste14